MVLAEDDVMGEGSVESCVVSAPKLAFLLGDVNFVLAGAVVAAVGGDAAPYMPEAWGGLETEACMSAAV
jgi:hypothetical protein